MNKIMLYVHIPFCEKKCNYCDFVSFNMPYDVINDYINNLISEIENKSYLANNYEISSIYIGGGTPSSIDKKYIKFIIESIYNYYNVNNDAEISIEVNPNSATKDVLLAYYESKINRLSIGLQSTNDQELKTLGRIHTYSDFLSAYDNALHAGFKNINVDLINGIPNQTIDSFKKTLKQVLSLNLKHISIYNLIIEKGTVFYDMKNDGKLILPLENDILLMDEITYSLTKNHNLIRYEISNYAKSGYECKHNIGYWSDTPYIGFGLNSASYFENIRYKNITDIKKYINTDYSKYMLSTDKSIYYDSIETIDEQKHINEYVMLGFRKINGINICDFKNKFNKDFEDIFKSQIKYYQSIELLCKKNDNYFLSDKGLNISNTILSDFLID